MRGIAMVVSVWLAGLAVSCAGTSGGGDVDTTPTARIGVDAHVGKNFTSDSTRVGDISDRFAPTETVFAVVDVPGSQSGTIRGRFVFGETETVQEQTLPIQQGINAYRFRLEPPAGGHRVGSYVFEVYINDNKAESEKFTVGG